MRFVIVADVDPADAVDLQHAPLGEWTLLPPDDGEMVGHFDVDVVLIDGLPIPTKDADQ